MRYETREFLNRLDLVPLFEKVGQDDCVPHVIVVDSLPQALEILRQCDNQTTRVLEINEIRDRLPEEVILLWNDLIALILPDVENAVRPNADNLPVWCDSDRESICNAAILDLFHAAVEYELSDYVKTRFFRNAAQWYLKGHLVCGWDYSEDCIRPIIY